MGALWKAGDCEWGQEGVKGSEGCQRDFVWLYLETWPHRPMETVTVAEMSHFLMYEASSVPSLPRLVDRNLCENCLTGRWTQAPLPLHPGPLPRGVVVQRGGCHSKARKPCRVCRSPQFSRLPQTWLVTVGVSGTGFAV